MRRTRRNSDDYIRDLERRVRAGDLTLVGALARAYERVQQGQPSVDPEILRALSLASGRLEDQVRSSTDNDDFWGMHAPGHQSWLLIRTAMEHLAGPVVDDEGNVISITDEIERVTRDPEECSECGDRYVSDDDRDPPMCDGCLDQAGQSDEEAAEERRTEARDRSRGRPGADPTWSHVSGAPECPATCPRCGNAGNLHHEAGEHYCAECDDFTAGHSLPGCPGVDEEDDDADDACAHTAASETNPGEWWCPYCERDVTAELAEDEDEGD